MDIWNVPSLLKVRGPKEPVLLTDILARGFASIDAIHVNITKAVKNIVNQSDKSLLAYLLPEIRQWMR